MLRSIFLLGLLAMVACLFTSCAGVRLSDGQAQALSDAKAGADVILDDRLWGSLDPTSREQIAHGVAGFIIGATQDADLPAPEFATTTIPAVASQYETAGTKSAREPANGFGAGVWGMIGAGGLAALGLLRFVPGAGGMVANLAYAYIAPKVDRITDSKAHQLYQHGAAVVQYGVDMANVAEAVNPQAAAIVQAESIALQKKLGIQSTIAAMVTAAKAASAAGQDATSKTTSPS